MKNYETIKQAMQRTKLSRATLMKFDKEGITFRVGRSVRLDSEALDKAIAEQGAQND